MRLEIGHHYGKQVHFGNLTLGAARIAKLDAIEALADVTDVTNVAAALLTTSMSLLSATTVSLAADAQTALYTVPAGKRCILDKAILVLGADAATTDISIGQNGATQDFLATTDLGLINAEFDACILQPIPAANVLLSKSYAATTVIEIDVSNQAGGASNTLFLFGMLY